jgi:putative DNA primase/helicase
MKKYIKVPFAEKDDVKNLGARWDKDMKSWYIPEDKNENEFAKWPIYDPATTPREVAVGNKIYLSVPFDDKDAVKSAGGRWDGEKKQWYYLSDTELAKFSKWKTSQDTTSSNKSNNSKPPKTQDDNDLSSEIDDILNMGE